VDIPESHLKILRRLKFNHFTVDRCAEALDTSPSAASKMLNILASQFLVESYVANKLTRFKITNKGLVALRRVEETQSGINLVPPRTFTYNGELYVPPKVMQRNDGNKHIKSRGF
jgi:predicted transcriptional regulator